MRTLAAEADRQSVVARFQALRPADRGLWGRMSPHQMVCHFSDSLRYVFGERPARDVSTLASRTLLKFVALRVPVRWPHGIKTVKEVEQGVGGTPPVEFERDRAALIGLLDRFCRARIDPSLGHPIFGPMSAADWFRWGYLHADHHLRQFGR
jgi:hypothetical protein